MQAAVVPSLLFDCLVRICFVTAGLLQDGFRQHDFWTTTFFSRLSLL